MRLLWLLLLAGTAQAQDDDLLFEDGAFVIQGKVQKPQVTVVIRRDNLDKGFDLQLEESFLKRIVKALEEPPF